MSNEQSTTLYIFRHGQTEWAVKGQHTGRTDIPLTEVGKEQAQTLGGLIKNIQFDSVFVSPLSRARKTAELAGLTDATVLKDLAEFDYGEYEGKTTEEIRRAVAGWTIWNGPCPGGETLDEAAQRCKNVIGRACEAGGKVALVAHGHILRILTATWLRLPPTEGKHFMLDTSTISVLSHERDNPAIKIWNCSADLQKVL